MSTARRTAAAVSASLPVSRRSRPATRRPHVGECVRHVPAGDAERRIYRYPADAGLPKLVRGVFLPGRFQAHTYLDFDSPARSRLRGSAAR
jgi:hypothetical protein